MKINKLIKSRKPYLPKYKDKIIVLNEHNHQYCIKCTKVMLYNKDNGICQDCDNGIFKKTI